MNAGLVAKGALVGAYNGGLIGLSVVGGATVFKHPLQRQMALKVTAVGALVGALIGAFASQATATPGSADAVNNDDGAGVQIEVTQPKPLGVT